MAETTIALPAVSTPAPAAVKTPSPNTLKTIAPSNLPETKGIEPKPAKSRMYADLDKKAGVQPTSEPTPKPASAPVLTEEPTSPVEGGEPTPSGSSPAGEKPEVRAAISATTDGKPAKANPWKLLDEYKGRLAKTEQELASTKSQLVPEAERKAFDERISKAESRAKELEDEIRFVDYRKSAEFNEKYQKPYEAAWHRAMSELKEINVADSDGNPRVATADDLLQLLNLPLGQAREVADSQFGKFADDVMNYRKELRGLFDAQNAALEDAKKNGGERDKQRQEQFQRTTKEMQEHIAKTWASENEKALNHEKYGQYFKPKEGDQEWNQRLAKGTELVDRAFAQSPLDPKLTAEQRADIIKRHAAVRNRAASWGAIRFENERLSTRISELEKELGKFKQSTPAPGGTQTQTATGVENGNAKDRLFSTLDKLAH